MGQRKSGSEQRAFEVLGISEAEEQVYRQLLARSAATQTDIARATRIPLSKAQRLLDSLQLKGLATYSPNSPRRYVPAVPDMAIEALIRRQQDCLQRARLAAQEIQAEVLRKRERHAPEAIVELIESGAAERLLYEQFHRNARHEIITLMRPPMRISSLDPPYDHGLQVEAQARGVVFRTIVDADFLALPGGIGLLRSEIDAGTQARSVPHLPFKMVLVDRRTAIIPLDLEQASSEVLLLRSSALLDALHALFEMLWTKSSPMPFGRGGDVAPRGEETAMPGELQGLISLMCAGMNDKAIAIELKMSARTFERRVVSLMKALGARTRFQAGWLAALRSIAGAAGKDRIDLARDHCSKRT